MTTTLKSLYKTLVNDPKNKDKKNEIKHSHDQHKQLSDKVQKIKKLIKSENPSWKQDEKFLKELLYKKDNGIASAGQSMLSKEQFHSFIENDNFMSTLGELILNPTETTLRRFEKVWEGQKGSNNIIRILRVVAASTLEVSTTVDTQKFNPLFDWLISCEMITGYRTNDSNYTEAEQWFTRNKFLMKAIKEKFQDELKSGATDEIYLSHFVWYLYEHSEPYHLKFKTRTNR